MKNITREEALELWLTTLEQHPERQTTSVLGTSEGKFCCLGQLCDLLLEREVEEVSREDSEYDLYTYEGETEELPKSVVKFMGFRDTLGELSEKYVVDEANKFGCLATMNDGGVSWSDIAKFIRENPEKVFVS